MKYFISSIFSMVFLLMLGSNGLAQNRPNVLWINADDLGIELGCYGNPDVKTPNIDRLAKQGILYKRAYANAPICSPSRSSMITGMYPPSANSHDHRTINMTRLPQGIAPITTYFKAQGYFCTNGNSHNMAKGGKEDFNFLSENLFDGTDWKQRAKDQPFFAQVQIHEPHRDFVRDKENPVAADKVHLPECYPDYPIIRADWALYLESVQECDKQVGLILDRLEKEGLADNTIVFFFGDNGRPHLRDKQFLYEGGLRVPLIVRYPNHFKPKVEKEKLVSLVDVTATSLSLAGIASPTHLQGTVFLGQKAQQIKYVYGFRDRAGDAVENMRSICNGRYKLIWNRTADRPWMQLSSYKKAQYPAFSLYNVLYKKGALAAPFNQFMAATKPVIELYDLKKDSMEFNNLAELKKHQKIKDQLFQQLSTQMVAFEKNRIPEDEKTIEKAKASSLKYYEQQIKTHNPAFTADTSDEKLLQDWENRLLKK
ncbi:sulfatase [Flavobacterium sp. UMI-01]|uniref:sulfatase family protein n=1 Tax=Flavobacterium sp. UMI-01 TaxID=1441053 RepID=UPI00210499E3|nr:sulfatase [Flavobacterium sp. UMI-01]